MSSGRIYSGRVRVSRLGPTLTAQPEIDQRAPTEADLGSTVSEQMSRAENVLEVVLTDENGAEHIYWVKTQKAPSDTDIEDWAIAVARDRHAVDGRPRVPEDEFDDSLDDELISSAFVSEPFEREPDEYIWAN